MQEAWKPVVGYAGKYEVSNWGRVRKLPRYSLVNTHITNGGHVRVSLSKDKEYKKFYVHQLVLSAFVGPCPEGMECCHYDGVPDNNYLDNLRYGTPKDNGSDRKRHGRMSPTAKLTDEDEREIKIMKENGISVPEIAKAFGVTENGIYYRLSK